MYIYIDTYTSFQISIYIYVFSKLHTKFTMIKAKNNDSVSKNVFHNTLQIKEEFFKHIKLKKKSFLNNLERKCKQIKLS